MVLPENNYTKNKQKIWVNYPHWPHLNVLDNTNNETKFTFEGKIIKQSVDFSYDKMKEFVYLSLNEINCNINTNKNY